MSIKVGAVLDNTLWQTFECKFSQLGQLSGKTLKRVCAAAMPCSTLQHWYHCCMSPYHRQVWSMISFSGSSDAAAPFCSASGRHVCGSAGNHTYGSAPLSSTPNVKKTRCNVQPSRYCTDAFACGVGTAAFPTSSAMFKPDSELTSVLTVRRLLLSQARTTLLKQFGTSGCSLCAGVSTAAIIA